VKFAIEPINRYETTLVNTVEAGLELVDQIGLDNVGLLLDTVHMNIEEPDVLQSIRAAASKIFHFHVADSNRWYPGAGHIDFGAILMSLDSVGYEGFISAEIMPFPDSDISAARTIKHMRALPQ
jgi:sugar phosphate isomerase/epimerase